MENTLSADSWPSCLHHYYKENSMLRQMFFIVVPHLCAPKFFNLVLLLKKVSVEPWPVFRASIFAQLVFPCFTAPTHFAHCTLPTHPYPPSNSPRSAPWVPSPQRSLCRETQHKSLSAIPAIQVQRLFKAAIEAGQKRQFVCEKGSEMWKKYVCEKNSEKPSRKRITL